MQSWLKGATLKGWLGEMRYAAERKKGPGMHMIQMEAGQLLRLLELAEKWVDHEYPAAAENTNAKKEE